MSRSDNTLQRLYSARAAIAYAISLDGEVYGPLLERIEREIAAQRGKIAVCDRAASILNEPSAVRFVGRFTGAKTRKPSHSN